MIIDPQTLAPFQEICRKICLNIPESDEWQWDKKRNMAMIIMAKEDAEMVFYPLFKEFQDHWNFSSISQATQAVSEFVQAEFGLMPGQALFTSRVVNDLVLAVAWWPWGRDDKVSMRVGLIPINIDIDKNLVYQCLRRWLNITA